MDRRFDPDPGKRTVIFIPADELSREFLLPVGAGYDILERASPGSKISAFYYFSTTFGCRDLPRMNSTLEKMTRLDIPGNAA